MWLVCDVCVWIYIQWATEVEVSDGEAEDELRELDLSIGNKETCIVEVCNWKHVMTIIIHDVKSICYFTHCVEIFYIY